MTPARARGAATARTAPAATPPRGPRRPPPSPRHSPSSVAPAPASCPRRSWPPDFGDAAAPFRSSWGCCCAPCRRRRAAGQGWGSWGGRSGAAWRAGPPPPVSRRVGSGPVPLGPAPLVASGWARLAPLPPGPSRARCRPEVGAPPAVTLPVWRVEVALERCGLPSPLCLLCGFLALHPHDLSHPPFLFFSEAGLMVENLPKRSPPKAGLATASEAMRAFLKADFFLHHFWPWGPLFPPLPLLLPIRWKSCSYRGS